MLIEGYLYQSYTKSILSRITEPIRMKLKSYPLNSVNEGRSIHTSPLYPTSHCQCVIVVVGITANRLSIITLITIKSTIIKLNGL